MYTGRGRALLLLKNATLDVKKTEQMKEVLVPTEVTPLALVWPEVWGSVAQTGVPKNLLS